MDNIVVIPARGGSKGVPGKNIKKLSGKPLLTHTIDVAKQIVPVENIIVSTDSKEIMAVAENEGLQVYFQRPAHLSGDNATSSDVLVHALDFCEKNLAINVDQVIFLQATSPFRRAVHIKEAQALYSSDIDMVVSVKITSSNPYYVLFEENENGYLEKSKKGDFINRQDTPLVYEFNGSIYIINPESLKKKGISKFDCLKKYEMGEIESVDIDTPLDWAFCEFLVEKRKWVFD